MATGRRVVEKLKRRNIKKFTLVHEAKKTKGLHSLCVRCRQNGRMESITTSTTRIKQKSVTYLIS